MNLVVNDRPGAQSLYIDGYLQFDQSDEKLYHESLVQPALHLAASAKRVLICGGGDGLAVRECLRFPGVERVDLVDYSAEVVSHARTTFAELNAFSLADPRVQVHLGDAWDFTAEAGSYDVIVCDFTFPSTDDDARVFSLEWFQRLRGLLNEGGTLAVNGVSPQLSPKAFACLVRTLRVAGFSTLPYRLCLPSFRQHGYGVWGFVLAAPQGLSIGRLRNLTPRVATDQADLTALWRGARFGKDLRRGFRSAPVSTLAHPALVRLLKEDPANPPSAEGLLEGLPAHHPFHTPEMIQTLAEQVAGSFTTLDLRKLIEELWKRASRLPERIREELARLRDFVRDRFFRVEDWSVWAGRVFATLLLVMVVANSLAPDNAYGKGSFGLGHASFSRGFSTSHVGPSHSSSFAADPHALTGSGFRGSIWNHPVDVYGYGYRPRFYSYGHSYYGSSYSRYRDTQPKPIDSKRKAVEHQAIFVADDDLMVMDDGSVIVVLSETAYLLIHEGTIQLMSQDSSEPVASLYSQPQLFQGIRDQIAQQRATLAVEIDARRDWLAWVGWAEALSSEIKGDQTELKNLRDLDRKLAAAAKTLGSPPENSLDITIPTGAVDLFVDCCFTDDGKIQIYKPDGTPQTFDVETLWKKNPPLAKVVKSVLKKMTKELDADALSYQTDLTNLAKDEASSKSDLAEYQSIQSQNPYEPDYEVDYGTDTVSVVTAISRTQQDLNDIQNERQQTLNEQAKAYGEAERMRRILASLNAAHA